MNSSHQTLFDKLFDEENGIVPKLQEQLEFSQKANERLLKQLCSVERTALRNAQYARRESLEFHGVPKSYDDNLEGKVIDPLTKLHLLQM